MGGQALPACLAEVARPRAKRGETVTSEKLFFKVFGARNADATLEAQKQEIWGRERRNEEQPKRDESARFSRLPSPPALSSALLDGWSC